MVWPRIDGLRTLELGMPGEQRRWLSDLVLAGRKRATAGRLAEYAADGEELEQPGERLVLVGNDGERLGLIEVVRVEQVAFADVPWEFAATENEGDESIEQWRDGHRAYWKAADGVDVPDSEPVVLVYFRLVDGVAS